VERDSSDEERDGEDVVVSVARGEVGEGQKEGRELEKGGKREDCEEKEKTEEVQGKEVRVRSRG
jgi:hypothetical protein